MLINPTRVASVAKAALAILCCVIIGVGLFYVAVPYLGTKANTTFGKVGGKKSEDPNARPAPQIGIQVGNKALEIEGEDIQGNKFKLTDYRGKVVMLDFWGNW